MDKEFNQEEIMPELDTTEMDDIVQELDERDKCLEKIMKCTNCDRRKASMILSELRDRLGIPYDICRIYDFWDIPVSVQEEMLRRIVGDEEFLECKERANPEAAASESEELLAEAAKEEMADQDDTQRVIVLSRNFATGLSVIRSLGAAGYKVDLVASAFRKGRSRIAGASKYVSSQVEVVSRKVKGGGDNKLVVELLKHAKTATGRKPVLFPTDDYTASIMDLNRSLFEPFFLMPTIKDGSDGEMVRLMDKTVQASLAGKAGLLQPKEWLVSLVDEDIELPDDLVFPVFCKPLESVTGYKREMAKCENVSELRRHLEKLQRRFADRSILVQEFLEIDYEIDMSGLCFDQEIIIPAIIKKTNVGQHEKGVTLAGRVVSFEEIEEVRSAVIAMLQEFHYTGMFDMELNVVGDKIYFNEVNLRSGGPNYSYFKSGVNLPDVFVKKITGVDIEEEEKNVDVFGKTFVYEEVAWNDYIHGYMTRREFKDCVNNADIKLLSEKEDPEPGRMFAREVKGRKGKQTIKRTIKSAEQNLVVKPLRKAKHTMFPYPQEKAENDRSLSEKPRVLVCGRNYCSNLSLARSFGEAGYEVEVLRIFQKKPKRTNLMRSIKPAAYSKYVKGFYIFVSRRSPRRIANKLISLANPDQKMLLASADDLITAVADDFYDELKEHYIISNINDAEGGINQMMEKDYQKKLAEEAGIPVINSCVIRTVGGVFEIPETVKYPCFIKPNVSRRSSKSRMKVCESQEDLQETLRRFSRKKDIEMLVEDYVEIDREFSILGLSTKDGAIGPGYFGAVAGGAKEHRGVAITGQMLPIEELGPLADKIINFIGSLGFDGLYDVDLIRTTSGEMYFAEINMRYGASGYALTKCGANLPGMFADYMIFGKPIDMDCKPEKTNQLFVNEKVLMEEYAADRISLNDVKEYMEKADIHFIENEEDPRPYGHFKKYFAPATMLKTAHKVKNKNEE